MIRQSATELFLRWAASGWIPSRWFVRGRPPVQALAAKQSRLQLEIVSHCWNYAHLLIYQLSSLVRNPPEQVDLTFTLFAAEEDRETQALVHHFMNLKTPGIRWNLCNLPKEHLFRRAIGRNQAALETRADWIWFTDCDVLFGEGCLDRLADALQGLKEPLVFPRQEYCTELLSSDSPILRKGHCEPQVLAVDTTAFRPHSRSRATGPLQITHGDMARACGYCRDLRYYQQPAASWCKAHEDRAFRWLIGSQGKPVEAPNLYRIRHSDKGRYHGRSWIKSLRSRIRRFALRFKEKS